MKEQIEELKNKLKCNIQLKDIFVAESNFIHSIFIITKL